jgi:HK97 family phage major capsid protein
MKGLIAHLKSLGYTIADDASKADVDAVAQKACLEGKLTLAKYIDLTAEPAPATAKSPFDELAERIATPILKAFEPITAALTKSAGGGTATVAAPSTKAATSGDDLPEVDVDPRTVDAVIKKLGNGAAGDNGANLMDIWKMANEFHREGSAVNVRVKAHVERFSDDAPKLKHRKGLLAGQVVVHNGQELYDLSERKNAQFGAWFKFQLGVHLSERDRDVVLHTIETEKFVGLSTLSTEARKLTDSEKSYFKGLLASPHEAAQAFQAAHNALASKTSPILDETGTSGGAAAVPEFFNFAAALEPALTQQVSPFVDIIVVPRGSSARAFTIGQVSVTSGPTEVTAATVFNSDDLLNSIDAEFFPANCSIEYGNDWMSDAVPQMGMYLRERINTAFGVYFDRMIVAGNGTTEPLGILNASGTVLVPSVNGVGGPLTYGDTINLFFGVPKAHREYYDRSSHRFLMTDTTYGRIRNIATGVTGDDRLIHGSTLDDYALHGRSVGIPQSGLTNSQVICAQLRGYTWYQRQSVVFRQITEGRTLGLANKTLIMGRSRQGGRLKFGSYAAVMNDAQS